VHERRSERSRPTGYLVVLIGAMGFVVCCFLPYLDYQSLPSQPGPPSLYRLIMLTSRTLAERAGGFAYLFAGVATLAWVAIAGIRGTRPWTPFALAAVTTAWSLTWIGTFIHQASILGPKEPGYWGLLVSIGVVVVGTVVVWVSSRPGRRPRLRDQPVPGE
jgi:hypothetical protein